MNHVEELADARTVLSLWAAALAPVTAGLSMWVTRGATESLLVSDRVDGASAAFGLAVALVGMAGVALLNVVTALAVSFRSTRSGVIGALRMAVATTACSGLFACLVSPWTVDPAALAPGLVAVLAGALHLLVVWQVGQPSANAVRPPKPGIRPGRTRSSSS